jgi:carbon-monoxide dehydrogenase small subunit
MKQLMNVTVNGRIHEVAVPPSRTLVELLRYDLGLTGTKQGCGIGECGTCTVLLDGQPVNSCLILALDVDGRQVTTIEGLANGPDLHPLQKAFIEKGAIQCGFCTPGMILTSYALLKRHPNPTDMEIRGALAGNLCRCTGYQKILEAVSHVVQNGLIEKEGGK